MNKTMQDHGIEYERSREQIKAWNKQRNQLKKSASEHGIVWIDIPSILMHAIRNSFHEGWEQGHAHKDEPVFPDLSKSPLLPQFMPSQEHHHNQVPD